MNINLKRCLQVAVLAISLFRLSPASADQVKWRVGDTMVQPYSYSNLGAGDLNEAARTQISNSISNELQRMDSVDRDLVAEYSRLEKSASRANSRNPLLRRSAASALFNQSTRMEAIGANRAARINLTKMRDEFERSNRLKPALRAKLASYTFIETAHLKTRGDLLKTTDWKSGLKQNGATFAEAQRIPKNGLLKRGFQFLKTPKGMITGALASVAIAGYQYYAAKKAMESEDGYQEAFDSMRCVDSGNCQLVYDDRQGN